MHSLSSHFKLYQLHVVLNMLYSDYVEGQISEQEYLSRAKPLDIAIGKLEMLILQDTLAWPVSFLPHTPKPEC